jgi:hypothetical protein
MQLGNEDLERMMSKVEFLELKTLEGIWENSIP